MDREQIFSVVQLLLAQGLGISADTIERGSNLAIIGCDDSKKRAVLERLTALHGVRLNEETGMAQTTVSGLCNYVVCQLQPEKPLIPTPTRLRSVCHWVL